MLDALSKPDSLYIDGSWLHFEKDSCEAIINPATEEPIGFAPVGELLHAEQAVAAARAAFDSGIWSSLSGRERAAKLQLMFDYLAARKREIVQLIVAEAGATAMLAHYLHFDMPMKHAQASIDLAVTLDEVQGIPPELVPGPSGKVLGTGVMVRQPLGVVTAITPYNFPFFLNLGKVFQALAAGCSVVLKPSPYTPFQALIFAEAAEAAGIPPGVFNTISGGVEVGEFLTSDPRVDVVSFTGSDLVGAAIQAQAAPTLKRVLLELGGKSALIVRADANLQAAAIAGLAGFTVHAGQGCALTTRHLVHNSVREDYVRMVAAMASGMVVGNPAHDGVAMGPLIREAQRTRTEEYVAIAQDDGARLVAGGKRPEDLKKGFFYRPTLFDDVRNDSRIAQEEVFGPVGVVIGFDSDEEAIALANDSQFGLGGAIYSADVGSAYEMALQVQTGNIMLNDGPGTMLSHAPFGGIKRSGFGKEYGQEGLNEFTYLKNIAFAAG